MTTTPTATCALICDCDGVLIDSEAISARILIAELSRRWPEAAVADTVSRLLGLRIEPLLRRAAEQLGESLDDDGIAHIRKAIEQGMLSAPLIPGVVAALQAIDLPMGCASNSYTAEVEAVLTGHDLLRFFGKQVFCADQVLKPKPAPDVYLAAARGLELPPSCCIVIEDSVAGVTSAAQAGARVLGFTGGAHSGAHRAEALLGAGASTCFDAMSQMPAMVADWAARIRRDRRPGDTRKTA